MNRTSTCWLALLAAIVLANGSAAEAQFRSAPEIQDSTRRVLDNPEFRHLRRRVREYDDPGETLPGQPDGGGEANGNGNGGAGERGENRIPPDRGERGRADDDRDRAREAERERERARREGAARRREARARDGGNDSSSSSSSSSGSGGGSVIGSLLHGMAWILLFGIAGLLVFFIVRGLLEREAPEEVATKPVRAAALDGEIEPDVAPGDVEADVYVRKGKELAAKGLFREAIAQLLLGAMSFSEQNGLLRFRRGLTFRAYATALSRAKTSQKAFRTLVALYEPLEYGRREPTREHYEAAQAAYDDGFRAPLVTRRTRPGAR